MDNIRIAVVGVGNMGGAHAVNISKGMVPGMELAAICDINPDRIREMEKALEKEVPFYTEFDRLLEDHIVDAILIATPHYLHPPMTIRALQAGYHVLCEKPAGVDASVAEEMNRAAEHSDKVFGLMFNQRTNPLFQRLKDMVAAGQLGQIKHFTWIIHNWYRTQHYYDSGDWRGSWNGEGGGVLINQCPHNLDLWQWLIGMPDRLWANCAIGKYHDITVEDDVTIFAEYDSGAVVSFITSTGEYPGTNRLEIDGSLGKAVLEGGKLTFSKLARDERIICRESPESMPQEAYETIVYEEEETIDGHLLILRNFTDHILLGTELIAPGMEGIKELTISNAAYLSAWKKEMVPIPLPAGEFTAALKDMQEKEKAMHLEKQKAGGAEPIGSGAYQDRWQVRW
ncbi:MAG: Gfo/Idh/MocA family oxidoreductase [Lachnospiraceae bacterium]|nr:Gfo/Idh/MocA family oxidoreductase [Lachnospiraceae bacterium]